MRHDPTEPAAKAGAGSARGRLTRGSIPRHVWVQTWPVMVGLSASMSVGIVDAYFVGQLGPDALAAIGFVFPVQVALQSLGVGVMVGINSVLSRDLGAGQDARAERRAMQGVLLGVLVGAGLGVGLWLGSDALFAAMGAEEVVLQLVQAYMRPYAFGFGGLLMAMSLNGVLRAQGRAVASSSILLVVAVANWVLDPFLITGWGPLPGYGVAGAAYATVLSFFLASVVALGLVQTSALRLRSRWILGGDFRAGFRALVRVGGPAAFANAVNPLGLTVLTALLAGHGAATVAAFGAASRVQSLILVPLLAMSSSIGPIVGQNWGAQAYGRARAAWRFYLGLCVVYGLACAGVLVGFRASVGAVFTDDPAVRAELADYFLVAAWGFVGFGILIVTNGALNAIDRATTALGVSLGRVFLVMVPAAMVGSAFGPNGVFASVLLANLAGGLAAYAYGRRVLMEAPLVEGLEPAPVEAG